MNTLVEGEGEIGGISSGRRQQHQSYSKQDSDQNLQHDFAAPGEAEIAPAQHLLVIVPETDSRKGQRDDDGQPHKDVAEIGPKERRHENAEIDQYTSHGGRARFGAMRLRTFLADELSDLKFLQLADSRRTGNDRKQQGRDAGETGSKRNVAKQVEDVEMRVKFEIEKVEHSTRVHPGGMPGALSPA